MAVSVRGAILLFSIAVVLIAPCAVSAQVLYGSLTGNITDTSGASVPKVKVDLLNERTGVPAQATTDERGVFLAENLQPGVYKVTITALSFATVVQSGVEIITNTLRRIDVQLRVAAIAETVTVAANAAALQTDRADINSQISTTDLTNLPMGGYRNFQSVLMVLPGVSATSGNATVSASNPQGSINYNVNGATNTGNNTKLDGASDLFPWRPTQVSNAPPAEAIETVSIVTNSFDAEQGIAAGSAVNVILKSGTNQFHGTAWEDHTNSHLKARNFFYYSPNNPKNILNQFGLVAGGPIKKNKLFFFADWERTVQRTLYSTFQTVATDALKQGSFAGTGTTIYDPSTGSANGTGRQPFPNNQIPVSGMSSAALKMATLLPAPNVVGGIANDYFAAANWQLRRDNIDAKINYNPSAKSSIFGRYSISPGNVFNPQTLGQAGGSGIDNGTPGTQSLRGQSVTIGATYTLTPHLLVDGNAAYSRIHTSVVNVDMDKNYGSDVLGIPGTNGPSPFQAGYPGFSVNGFSSFGGSNTSTPLEFRGNMFVETVNLSWTKGSHSLRFGAELFHLSIINFQANTSSGVRGGFSFSGGPTALNGGTAPNLYNAWGNFLLGLPTSMGQDHQYINPAAMIEPIYGFFARDQWQVSRKLTVTYGLRYEIYPYSHGEHGLGGIHYDPATNIVSLGGINGVPYNGGVDTGSGQFAPRLGVAYRLNEKTVVRAGYGININAETWRNNVQTYPDVISAQYSGPNSYAAAGSLVTGIPAFVGPNLSLGRLPLPPNYGSWTYPTPFQRGYAESYNVTVQRDLWAGFNAQAAYVGNRDIRPESGVDINAAAPGTGSAGQPFNVKWGNTSRISELAPLDASKYNALQLSVKRRLSKGTLGLSYTFSKALAATESETGNSLTWNWGPVRYRNYATASFDTPHNLVLYAVYPLPFGKGEHWLNHGIAAVLAGGWQVNTIMSRASGRPFTVSSATASLNAPGNSQTGQQMVTDVQILGGHGPGEPYFDPNAFAPVTTVAFGNSGRDILRGPGSFNIDAGLFRAFSISDRFKLQFRAESFGLTNSPVFANPSATVSNATFSKGVITNLNGYDTITSSTGERQIRFALKVSF